MGAIVAGYGLAQALSYTYFGKVCDIPEGTDLSKYNTVSVWCKSFSVLFGSAELTRGMSA